jgi:GNAT superfamily N-acetyltransferase
MVRSLNDSAVEGPDDRNIAVRRVLDVAPFETTAHPAIGPITTPIRRHELDRVAALISSGAHRTRAYVAWIEDTPVGAIELFLGTDAAGVHGLHVPPAWQRRGVASALLEYVCREAARSGYASLVLLASNEGQRLAPRFNSNRLARPAQRPVGRTARTRSGPPPCSGRSNSEGQT